MKILPQQLDFKGNITQQFLFIENEYSMKKIQAPKVAAIKMQFGELKSNP
jgi:hypothetical protein